MSIPETPPELPAVLTEELAEEFRRVIENLEWAENRGREIATKDRERGDVKTYLKVHGWASSAGVTLHKVKDFFDKMDVKPSRWIPFSKHIADALLNLINQDVRRCMKSGVPLKDCEVSRDTQIYVSDLDYDAKGLIGSRCTWLFGEVPRYTLTMAINDITSCLHRVLEKAKTMEVYGAKKIDKCYIRPEADESLVEACKTWNKELEKINDNKLLLPNDYERTQAIVEKDKMTMRVGSSPGHATVISLKEGKLRYFDTDHDVNQVIRNLLEEVVGLKCLVRTRAQGFEPGVECWNLTRENVTKATKTLAYATSMDYRLRIPDEYWRYNPKVTEIYEKCLHKAPPLPSEREVCQVKEKMTE